MEHIITIPRAIHSDFEGYASLLELFQCYIDDDLSSIVMDFRGNTWFDSNLLSIIYAYVVYGKQKDDIKSIYRNQQDCRLNKLLIRNGFGLRCFDLEYRPRENET